MLATTLIAFITGTHFNGLLNIGFAKDSGFIFFLIENFAGWISISIFLYMAGFFIKTAKEKILISPDDLSIVDSLKNTMATSNK